MGTFNYHKYDKTEQQNKNSENGFMFKRDNIIKMLLDITPLIVQECESLETFVENNPNHKAVIPFKEKLGGWSRILSGIDTIKKMYIDKRD